MPDMDAIAVNEKRRGRPRTGIRPPVGVRLYPEEDAALEIWLAVLPEGTTKSEAIRMALRAVLLAAGADHPLSRAANARRLEEAGFEFNDRNYTWLGPPVVTEKRRGGGKRRSIGS